MLKVNKKDTRKTSTDIDLTSLLLTLNTFTTLNLFFYRQLESGLSLQSCLYFEGFCGLKLFNVCSVV